MPTTVVNEKVTENSEMGDKNSNAKGVSPHLIVVSRGLARESTPLPRFFNHPEVMVLEVASLPR